MGKIEDRRSKRQNRTKPARFDSPLKIFSPNGETNQTTALFEAKEKQTFNSNILEFPNLRSKKPGKALISPNSCPKKLKKRRNSDTSSDEERWLTAIEHGKLDDVDDEMKKIKDPKLMTARQRAMYERTLDADPTISEFAEELLALPSGYKEKEKPQTAEEIQRAVLKSQKRKKQADERREKDKKKTMDRLLKKQESSKQRVTLRNKLFQKCLPKITYISSLSGTHILVSPGQEYPLKMMLPFLPPAPKLCVIPGCGNVKVYNCSKTNAPLCSLNCYKKNLCQQ